MTPPRIPLPCAAALLLATASFGIDRVDAAQQDFADLTLAELMSEPITSVSKRATRLGDTAAAVIVITAEDIRRSGVTTLPEALRLATGMEVAKLNSHSWAVSARGFLGPFADKMLVMIDGRTIYEPTFTGVDWGGQDVVFEDLDRIEIIRGPGATLWGANAVNGVINIITKDTVDTHGTLAAASFGTDERPSVTLRHGGKMGADTDYRVYLKYFDREGLLTADGSEAVDDWSATRGGFRMDQDPTDIDSYTLQAELFHDRVTELDREVTLDRPFTMFTQHRNQNTGGHVLGRWTRAFSESSQFKLQSFYNYSEFHLAGAATETGTFDIDMQHQFQLSDRQELLWGVGYRYIEDSRSGAGGMQIDPADFSVEILTGFVQDEIALVPERLKWTIGTKLEHNEQIGFEVQPSTRLAWTPSVRQTVWASVSRAVRTPDRFELGGRTDASAFAAGSRIAKVELVGNPNLEPETLVSYELGYRAEPASGFSLDLATYYNVYDELIDFTQQTRTNAPTRPHIVISRQAVNGPGGDSYGAELSLRWKATDRWRLDAGYNWMRLRFLDGSPEFDSPEQQAHLRSHLTLPWALELNGAILYTDRLRNDDVDAYLRLDVGVIWRPTPSIEAGVWGHNLLDAQHTEFTNISAGTKLGVPRTGLAKIVRRF